MSNIYNAGNLPDQLSMQPKRRCKVCGDYVRLSDGVQVAVPHSCHKTFLCKAKCHPAYLAELEVKNEHANINKSSH